MKRTLTCFFTLLALLVFVHGAAAKTIRFESKLEGFRLDSMDKLDELYKLRNIYIDNKNTDAVEAVQIFIGEVRKNILLVSNIQDLTFLYDLQAPHDEKGVVWEYVSKRFEEIKNNINYNIETINGMQELLLRRGQQTLAKDFLVFKKKLEGVYFVVDSLIHVMAREGRRKFDSPLTPTPAQ